MGKRKGQLSSSMAKTACCEVERPKDLKRRIKQGKKDLKLVVELSNRGHISYEVVNQAIGSMYLEIHRLKERLRSH